MHGYNVMTQGRGEYGMYIEDSYSQKTETDGKMQRHQMMRLMYAYKGADTCITIFTHTGVKKKIISMKTSICTGYNSHSSKEKIVVCCYYYKQ